MAETVAWPGPRLGHLHVLLDDTGILQHATYGIAAREHGYCLDDNARGLLLALALARSVQHRSDADRLLARTAAFVQHAWSEKRRRFRNFMGYDRQWLEEAGSEDSHGRAVWALGTAVRDAPDGDVRAWALQWLDRAAPALPGFTSPRALACGLLGLVAGDGGPGLRAALADRLCDHLRDNRHPDWLWFEASLSYDNAHLSEALLAAGDQAGRADWVAAGLETLRWLCRVQTTAAGLFAPVGSEGFWHRGGTRARFDQQPLEAASIVSAALRAWRMTGDRSWMEEARRAHAWFGGANELGQTLVNPVTGACRDGLHASRVNANQGAESTLAWLQADIEFNAASAADAPALAGVE